jgi:predicted ATPase
MRFKGDRSTTPIVLTFNLDPSAMGKKESHELNYQIMLRNVSDGTNFSLIENLFTVGIEENDPRYYLAFLNGKGKYWNYSKNFERWDVDEYDLGDGRNLALSMISPSTDRSYINLIRNKLRNLHVYEHFDTAIGSKIRRPVIATSEKRLIDDGSNLSQMLNTIKINDKDNHARLINQLKAVNDQFTGIDFNFLGGNIELMLEESKFKSSVHVTHISDGTLRFLCLMAIFFNENRGGFICIDEPELGLHPDMIKGVVEAMAKSYENTQYIITTHSDHLLDLFDLENIRVVEKDENNASRVRTLNPKKFEGWYEHFSPGRMWRMGDFGGNRF